VAAAVVVVAAAVVVVAAAVVVVAALVVVVAAAVVVVAAAVVVVAAAVVVVAAAVVVVAAAVVVVVAPVGTVMVTNTEFNVVVPLGLRVTRVINCADTLPLKIATTESGRVMPSADTPLVGTVKVQGSTLNSAPTTLIGCGALKVVTLTLKVHEPKVVVPLAWPSALVMAKFGWVASAVLAVKVT
jgi:uncharacterized membrane protein YoaK (UPF0700 family)